MNPEWNETFFFELDSDQVRIKFVVWDHDLIGKDFMGEVIVPYIDTLTAQKTPIEKWYPLEKRKSKDEISGEIFVKISFRESVCTYYCKVSRIMTSFSA